MKKITKEEAEKMLLQGKGRSSPVMSMLQAMKVGEILFVESKEWKWQRGPGTMCKRLEQKYGLFFKCAKVVDGSGWVIERIAGDADEKNISKG